MSTLETSVEPDWGIAPVPPEARRLSGFDLAILWGDLGIGLLVLVTGALLVPALGFSTAFAIVIAGSVAGCLLLGLAGSVGTRVGVPTMVLFRSILGERGSWVPSTLNVAQLVGWTAVELWAISFVADIVSVEAFSFSARWLWLVAAAVLCAALALWGPVGVTRVWMERFGAWVIATIALVATILVVTRGGFKEIVTATGTGGFPGTGAAFDLVLAMPVSWLPLVADYNRFGRDGAGSFRGTFFGYLVANVWLYTLGIMLVLGVGAEPSPAGIATGILSLGAGTIAGLLFLLGLLVGEVDEAFADVYSGAMSVKNVFPRIRREVGVVAITAIAALLAGWLTMERYESFLFLIGSVFVPLFGIFLGHYFFRRDTSTTAPAAAWVAWIGGFGMYHAVAPTGPAWWLDFVGGLPGEPLGATAPWLSASVVAFAVALGVYLVGARLSSKAKAR